MTHPISLMNLQYYISSKVKNYNLNVTEVRDSDFKNAFLDIFNFTVGILTIKVSEISGKLIFQDTDLNSYNALWSTTF